MKSDDLLEFVKACARHWNRPASMFVEFSIDYRNNGVMVRARDKGCCHNVIIPFAEIEKVGESAVSGYFYSIDRAIRNQCYKNEINSLFGFSMYERKVPKIKRVIFNDPATIVLWSDNTKTIVKAENETFDPEKGLAMAITKKALGNEGNYYNELKKYLGDECVHKKVCKNINNAEHNMNKLKSQVRTSQIPGGRYA